MALKKSASTVCPGSSGPFYIVSQLYKTRHNFLDTQYLSCTPQTNLSSIVTIIAPVPSTEMLVRQITFGVNWNKKTRIEIKKYLSITIFSIFIVLKIIVLFIFFIRDSGIFKYKIICCFSTNDAEKNNVTDFHICNNITSEQYTSSAQKKTAVQEVVTHFIQ